MKLNCLSLVLFFLYEKYSASLKGGDSHLEEEYSDELKGDDDSFERKENSGLHQAYEDPEDHFEGDADDVEKAAEENKYWIKI